MPYLSDELLFILMVSVIAFLLAQSLITPAFGENRKAKKRLKKRLKSVRESFHTQEVTTLLREKYLRQLSPLERQLESLPGMTTLATLLDQAGYEIPAYRFVLICIGLAGTGSAGVLMFTQQGLTGGVIGVLLGVVPILKIQQDRLKRLNQFEEQLPDALDIMTRAMRAGHPFTSSLQLVAEELEGPVAKEFGVVFTDINYGGDLRGALLGLLSRVPSVTVMALVTAVLIQKESGGNLAEILEKLTALVRGRFRFQRQIRIYTAEGRMSAWVLILMPFVLAGILHLLNPEYMAMLIKDPTGRKLIGFAFLLMVVGIFWVRKIIRIDV